MSARLERVFRAGAVDRLTSPDQLDRIITATRPVDWIGAVVIVLGVIVLASWGFLGRVTTLVAGDGILLAEGGVLADAVSDTSGRIEALLVAVGDQVIEGQPVARLAQPELAAKAAAASATLRERQQQYDALAAAAAEELKLGTATLASRRAALEAVVASAGDSVDALERTVRRYEGLTGRGLMPVGDLDQARIDLYEARFRVSDARNEIVTLEAQFTQQKLQRGRDLLDARFRVEEARRAAEQLTAELARDILVSSPIAGRVTAIKAPPGSYLAPGHAVASIESAHGRLHVVAYLPGETGRQVRPGQAARVVPATVRREEHGVITGHVEAIPDFPESTESIVAKLPNPQLAQHLLGTGVAYGATIQLDAGEGAGGYRWSSGKGAPTPLGSGVLARVEIVTRERRPIDLVLPFLRRLTGFDG